MKNILLALLFVLAAASVSRADVLYLKNGTKVKGQIIQETGYSYKVMVDKTPYTYYTGEVAKVIKGDEPVATLTQEPEVSAKKQDLILRLMEINGARQTMARLFNQIIQKAPEKERPIYQEILKVNEVMKQIVPVYAKHYSEAELKELIAFYSSPTGSKHLATTPRIMEETMKEVEAYFQEMMKALSEQEKP